MVQSAILNVNGQDYERPVNLDAPLLYFLRNELLLKGPRFGCGLGQCGICSVLLDGRAVRSCILPVAAALATDGHSLVTLEGLGTPDDPHPVQQAFIDEQAVQCGYCVNGQIMGAVDLLSTNRNPSTEEINRAMQPYLCRCGTHARVVRAIRRAAIQLKGAAP